MMIVRFLPAVLAAAVFAVACSDPAPTTDNTSSRQTKDSDDDSDRESDDDKDSDETASTDAGKGGTKETQDAAPADPGCVASCNSSLKTKCQGDETFCEFICSAYSTAVIACLTAAPTCEKPEFVRCEDENGGGGK